MAGLTPFQTVGPFLHIGLRSRDAMTAAALATPIVMRGRLLDGAGAGMVDGLLEFWAAGFDTLGRVWTGADGGYHLATRLPLAHEHSDGTVDAPHFVVRVMARGVLTEYITRVYFDGDPANASDRILQLVPAARRATLIAKLVRPGDYRFDIVVQGEGETVFFDV